MSSVSSTSSSTSRITGMVSGLDTDTIVSELMEAEKIPLNKLYQKKQLAEWKQEAYREISNSLRVFNDKYFNYLNSDTNLLSKSTLKKFTSATSDDSVVTATANSEAEAASHTVKVLSVASAQVYESGAGVIEEITANKAADFSSVTGKSFVMTIDGSEYTISLDSSVTSISTLQTAIDNEVGSGKVIVGDTAGDGTGYLTIASVEDSGVGKITLSDGDESALSYLGFTSSSLTNRYSTDATLQEIAANMTDPFSFNSDDEINLTINGIKFTFSEDTTLSDMMDEINNSDAGVTMKYSETTGNFTFTAKNTGAGSRVKLEEEDSTFLEKLNFTQSHAGTDAVVLIDGEKLTRNSNSITKDGVTYKVLSESDETQSISLTLDSEAILDKITQFVNDYNELIEAINTKIDEEYDRDYPPLTDEQKDEMTDDEIESWEEAAKTGLLENDSTLINLLSKMRLAIYQSVSGASVSLSEIGITTTSDYDDKGKLTIDSDILEAAISTNIDDIATIFSKSSTTYPGASTVRTLSSSERKVRTEEEGLAYRIYDILQDNISTYRGLNGEKGTLIVKAGITGDSSNTDNDLTDLINDYAEDIDEMLDKLDDKEDYYYEKFSNMETYISQMNSQLSSLQSSMG